jgi:hypothetical protein
LIEEIVAPSLEDARPMIGRLSRLPLSQPQKLRSAVLTATDAGGARSAIAAVCGRPAYGGENGTPQRTTLGWDVVEGVERVAERAGRAGVGEDLVLAAVVRWIDLLVEEARVERLSRERRGGDRDA